MFFYRLFITLMLPFATLRLFIKSRHNKEYRHRILERFAINLPETLPEIYLIHTVSVGEFLALKPLIERFLKENKNIWLTCTTPTGSQQIQALQALFPEQIRHSYLPYDNFFLVKRFLKHVKPKALILMETEIWAELIIQMQKYGAVILENARLSARSCRRYAKFLPNLIKKIIKLIFIHAQDKNSARRFRFLGANRIAINPNIKYAYKKPAQINNPPNKKGKIFLAASTHSGEEALILEAWKIFQRENPDWNLWLAPRHFERRFEVEKLLQTQNFNYSLRSQENIENKGVFIIDTLGELSAFFHFADIAFIGGSLIPRGGHNPLEALHAEIPIIFGKFMFNFQTISEDLLKNEFAIQIDSSPEALLQALNQLKNEKANPEIKKLINSHSNLLQIHYELIQREINNYRKKKRF